MEWIEKHPVLITVVILVIGYIVQVLYTRWRVGELVRWQAGVDGKLTSIDLEINQIKISDAKESVRMETLSNEMSVMRGEMTHIKTRIDDVHEMLIIALSGGILGDRLSTRILKEKNEKD
jgi:hypothetical protein